MQSKMKRNKKHKQLVLKELPTLPDKIYFTISEVGRLCGVETYVLRYWEQEFSQLKQVKRRGNRRYYQHHDILLVRSIRKLLYEDGFTIEGARSQLSQLSSISSVPASVSQWVKKVIADLESVLHNLQADLKISH